METKKIYLGNFETAVRFIQAVDHMDARLILRNHNSVVNAKSLLGVLSMKLNEPITLEINGTDTDRAQVNLAIKEYIAS